MCGRSGLGARYQFIAYLSFLIFLTPSLGLAELYFVSAPTLKMNPFGVTPLSGLIEFKANIPVRATLSIEETNSATTIEFEEYEYLHRLPVLGLKPNTSYVINLLLVGPGAGPNVKTTSFFVTTDPLPPDFPRIQLLHIDTDRVEPGYTLLDRLGLYNIVVDQQGHIVWYASDGGNAARKLPNGNLLIRKGGTTNNPETSRIVEQDMLGQIYRSWHPSWVSFPVEAGSVPVDIPLGFAFHHDVFPTAHGTLMTLTYDVEVVSGYPTSYTDANAPTETIEVRDEVVVEFLPDGSIINQWSMLDMLDRRRIGYNSITQFPRDWGHSNAVVHDPKDDSVIVSLRHQDAVIKFSRATGALKWILGPHDNWATPFQPFLLSPKGRGFEWQYHQHAPMVTPQGTILMFDNGTNRASPLTGQPKILAHENYSRAVEFLVREGPMQAWQVWEYGSDVNQPLYTSHIGDADWLEKTGNVLITFGQISFEGGVANSQLYGGEFSARVIEVDRLHSNERVFDLLILGPTENPSERLYRSERIPSLYPPDVRVTHSVN